MTKPIVVKKEIPLSYVLLCVTGTVASMYFYNEQHVPYANIVAGFFWVLAIYIFMLRSQRIRNNRKAQQVL